MTVPAGPSLLAVDDVDRRTGRSGGELDVEAGPATIAATPAASRGGSGALSRSRATSPRVALTMWLTAVRRPARSVNARTATRSAARGVQAAA